MQISYEQRCALQADLNNAAELGRLTVEALDQAVRSFYSGLDAEPESVGFMWIVSNIGRFADLIENDPWAFFERHFELGNFSRLVLCYTDILALVPGEKRLDYIRRVILEHGSQNLTWVRNAIEVGVSEQDIAQIVLDKLEATTEHDLQFACFLWSFLKHGMGRVEPANPLGDALERLGCDRTEINRVGRQMEQVPALAFAGRRMRVDAERDRHDSRRWRFEHPTEWSVLSDDQFERAIHTCGRKAPIDTMHAAENIRRRLGWERGNRLLINVVVDLCLVVNEPVLSQLPLKTRLRLAKQLSPIQQYANNCEATVKFLTRLYLEYRDLTGFRDDFEDLYFQILANVRWNDIYYHAMAVEPTVPIQQMAKTALRYIIIQKAERAGWRFGTLRWDEYRDQRRGTSRQLAILNGNEKFVLDRASVTHRSPIFGDGERVMFNPKNGRRLTPFVTAVMFHKISNDRENSDR